MIGLLTSDDDYGAIDISSDETTLYFSTVFSSAADVCVVTVGKIDLSNEAISWQKKLSHSSSGASQCYNAAGV